MMQKRLFVFCLIIGSAGVAAAQTRSVTNTDLEKYRQDRVKAERDYRENYEKLGMPSPEELARKREKDRIEAEKLSAELRSSRLERERLDAERQASERRAAASVGYFPIVSEPEYGFPTYIWSYGRRNRFPVRRTFVQPGYFAGGQFWPTPVRTPQPRTFWIRPR